MKINKIAIHNFLKLETFKTDRLGKLIKVTGDNEMGKSSFLLAIKEAFKSSGVDPGLIHIDADKAEIIIELDDKILIQRKITPSSNSVRVTVDGQPMDSPQTWLKSLLGPFNFDPIDFFKGDSKKRRANLLSAIPFTLDNDPIKILGGAGTEFELDVLSEILPKIEFSKHGLIVLQEIAKAVYDRRYEVNLDVTRQRKAIEQDKIDLGDTTDLDRFKDFNVEKSVEELSRQREANQEHDRDQQEIESLRGQAVDKKNEIERLENRIVELKAEVAEINDRGKALVNKGKEFQPYETEELQKSISEFYHYQKVLNRLDDIKRREGQLENSRDTHKSLDDLHKALVGDVPKRLLEKIKLPVDGLEIKGDKIKVNRVDLDKMSKSAKMKIAVKIARSLAGKLKIVLMDEFESVGAEGRKAFIKETASDGFQYVIAQVTEGPLAMESIDGELESKPVKEDKYGRGEVGTSADF